MQTVIKPTEKSPTSKLHFAWENIELSICLICMVAMTAITFVQVIARYVFLNSLTWAEEICRFLVVWLTFAGSAYAFRKGAHVSITALADRLPNKLRVILNILISLVTIFFFVVLLYYGWEHTYQQILNGQVAPATRLPIAISYLAVPIGSLLVILRLAYDFFKMLKNLKAGVK